MEGATRYKRIKAMIHNKFKRQQAASGPAVSSTCSAALLCMHTCTLCTHPLTLFTGAGGSGVAAADKPEWREYNSDDEEVVMTAPRTSTNGKARAAVVVDADSD